MWRGSAAYAPPLRNGMAVVAHGRLSFYETRGECQLYVDAVEDAGIGLLHLRFEELKARLDAEGLFDDARKRPIPARPAVVGLVTSPTGAALRDMLRVLRARCPLVSVLLAPTLVQGEGAAERVAAAIDALNAHGAAEVIVVARGGGSLEDLWAFNEEPVARAIARSHLPVITGVGHETDFTIADFVADYRASTPTAAAIACVPDGAEWRRAVREAREQLAVLAAAHVARGRERLATARHDLRRASPAARILAERQRVDETAHALAARMRHLLQLRRERLRGSALRLHALSPLLTLGRGYAIVRAEPGGALVARAAQVTPGQGLTIQLADGRFAATAGPRLAAAEADVSGDGMRDVPAPRRQPVVPGRPAATRMPGADVMDGADAAGDG
jgi:exodeoxyribonuclease VII large subunit